MKNILLLIVVCLGNMWTLKAQGHPVIYASASDKETIQQKIADEEWAKEAFNKIRGNVEKYADRHAADPQCYEHYFFRNQCDNSMYSRSTNPHRVC